MKVFFAYVFVTLLPIVTFAQGSGSSQSQGSGSKSSGGVDIPNPLGDVTIIGLFQTLLDVVMIFAVPLVVLCIIYAGFLYVTARGNTDTISKAHNALLYAVIGGVLILGANVLIEVIDGTVKDIGTGL